MRRSRYAEDLTIEELRRLLVEKRRKARHEQLDRFRRTGRVVTLASDAPPALDGLRSGALVADAEAMLPRLAPSRFRRVMDGFLLLVEILAVAGLLFVIYSFFEGLHNINQEAATGQVLPTLTPTPLIAAIVLPGGHTPPDAQGRSRFNEAEIPEHLRPIYQSLAEVPIPTPGPEQAIRIQIPAIGVDAPVVQGDGDEQLKKGVAQRIGSANPGQPGNMVLSAHNDIYGEIFRYLDQLRRGDPIIVYTNYRAYTYIVSESPRVVEPTQVDVMAPTSQPVVTLISCYPYWVDNKRIIIRAHLEDKK
jgi:sortase A